MPTRTLSPTRRTSPRRPRLQELRALFNPPAIGIAGIGDPAFTGFVATVVPKAQPLTADDRDQIRRSHLWRLRAESKFTGTPDVVSQAGTDVLNTILHSFPPAAPGPVVAPPAPVAAVPPPVPNPSQRAWLGGIHITAPVPSVTSNTATQSITFAVRSAVPNPALPVNRRVALDPAAKVSGDPVKDDPWPSGSDTMPVTFDVLTDAGAPGGSTVFTAHLTMPPLTAATFAEQTASVTVVDNRLTWFKAHVRPGLEFMLANVRTAFSPVLDIRYYGGHLPVFVMPSLPAPNPDLTIFIRGRLKRSGVVIATFPPPPAPPILFDAGARSVILGSTIVAEATPPSAGPEAMELTIEFVASQAPGAAVLHSIVQPFTLKPAAPVPGGDAGLMAADNARLNAPIGTAGSLLHFMSTTFLPGSPEELVANAVAAGTIKIAATFVRSDSAAWLRSRVPPIDPTTNVAYAMGAVTDARTMAAVPGAIGWRWPAVPDTVFLNLTPDPTHPLVKRGNAELAGLLSHEGIHAADLPAVTFWERYATEFRAYWIGGLGAALSTDVDQTMDAKGPKSPRARSIFDHLYNSGTYTFVKPNYDTNANHFRELADALVSPDGINLSLSQGLRDLRAAVENVAPPYATRKVDVTAKFGLLTPSDRDQVRTNRAWRDLVESKFIGLVPAAVPAVGQAQEIKTILGIPQ